VFSTIGRLGKQREFLVNGRDTGGYGIRRPIEGNVSSGNSQMTSFGAHDAGEHPKQGTLSGAIVADEAVDLARFHGKRNPIQDREISKYFRYLNRFQPAFGLRDHCEAPPFAPC
jgi:hypothetical protein